MSLYHIADKRLREQYDVDLLDEIVLAREDRAIYYVEYKSDSIVFNKIHGNSPMDFSTDGDCFTYDLLEDIFDMDSKYGEVAGRTYYKELNLGRIKDMNGECNVTIPLIIDGERYWTRFHSYAVRKNEQGKTTLASCYITDVTKYLVREERLYEKTHKDELTRLFNRYALYYHFELRGKQTPITSYYFDVDDFKTYNDTYGHEVGDHVLQNLSSKLIDICEERFTCYRLGGDEFYCLLMESTPEETTKYAALIEKAIHESNVPEINDDLTVSIGVVTTNDDITEKYEPFMKQGDEMMYVSKKKGKNTVTYSTFEVYKK